MSRNVKLASIKVDQRILQRIKTYKNRHELEEKSIVEFVNKTLEEKLNKIVYEKIMKRIEKEGLDSILMKAEELQKIKDDSKALGEKLSKVVDDMMKRRTHTR